MTQIYPIGFPIRVRNFLSYFDKKLVFPEDLGPTIETFKLSIINIKWI